MVLNLKIGMLFWCFHTKVSDMKILVLGGHIVQFA